MHENIVKTERDIFINKVWKLLCYFNGLIELSYMNREKRKQQIYIRGVSAKTDHFAMLQHAEVVSLIVTPSIKECLAIKRNQK